MKEDRLLETLAWRYPLERHETAAGFASRLGALNGNRLGKFLRQMCIHPREVDKAADHAIRSVAVLGGVDAAELDRNTPKPVGEKFYEVSGERLRRASILRTYFRFCPHCILDDLSKYEGPPATRPWLRLEWTISHFRVCDRHQVYLHTAHPVRRPFEPFDFNYTMTGLLHEMASRSRDAEKAAPSPFQAWLSQRLENVQTGENWLDDVPLYAAVEFCEALGLSALHAPKVKTSTLSLKDWTKAADEGFTIASSGEESLRILLARLNKAQENTRGVWGPRDTYGYAYGLLQKTVADPAYQKFRDVVRRFAIETMPLKPGTKVLGNVITARKVHTVRSASKDSGAHALTIRRLFERKGLTEDRENSGLMDHRVTVSSSEIHHIVESLKDALTTPDVERVTKIPRLHLKEMIVAGYLPTVMGTQFITNAKHRFARVDVDAMMARLFDGAETVDKPGPRQMSIPSARKAATCSIAQILGWVFEDKLRWKGRLASGVGYGALLVDADEIVRLVRSDYRKSGLTKEEVRDFVPGMGRYSVQKFIDCGHLGTTEEFNPEARRLSTVVMRESAVEFRDTHVSLGELCQQTGLHHKKVRLLLRTVGIEAAFDPDTFGCFFYSRAAVQRVEREDTHFWQYDKAIAQQKARARKDGTSA